MLLEDAINEGGFDSFAEFGRANNVTRAYISSLVGKKCSVNEDNCVIHTDGRIEATFSFEKVEHRPQSYQEVTLSKYGWNGSAPDLVRATGVDRRVLFGFIDNGKIEKLKLVIDAGLWRIKK